MRRPVAHDMAIRATDGSHESLVFARNVTRVEIDLSITNLCQKLGAERLSDLRDVDVTLDFSGSHFIELDAAHWLLNILRIFRKYDNAIVIRLPDVLLASDSNIWSFLLRWRFFNMLYKVAGPATDFLTDDQAPHLFDEPKYRESRRTDPYGHTLPLLTDRLLAIDGAFVDRSLPLEPQLEAFVWPFRDVLLLNALAQSCGIASDDAGSLISYISEEAARNAILHADGDYTLSSMQIIDEELAGILGCDTQLKIIISDNGLGIPDVLRRAVSTGAISTKDLPEDHASLIELFASKEISVDSAIIAAATLPGTRGTRRSRGLGLHHLITYAADLDARVVIRSGFAAVQFDGGEVTRHYKGFSESLGTLITVTIPTAGK